MTMSSGSSDRFTCVADALGLGTLADGDDGCKTDALCALYRHARGEDGKRVLFEHDPTFVRGWVNLDSARAREIISPFVSLEDADDLKHAKRMAQSNLEAAAWNDVLGIENPPIRCRIKIHGPRWALRFESTAPCLKGCEVINEALPPLPNDAEAATGQPATQVVSEQKTKPAAISPSTVIAPTTSPVVAPPPAEEVLRKGGLPV